MSIAHAADGTLPVGPPRGDGDEPPRRLRVCMVLYDLQDFGGLEEYAVNLAMGLRQLGHDVSFVSAAWAADDNQYKRRLQGHDVPFVQVPRWLSLPASDWNTKIEILEGLVLLASPLAYPMGLVHWAVKRGSWRQSMASVHGWLRSRLLRVLGPDRRQALGRRLLRSWCRRWQPDVLHLHGYTTNLLFAIDWARAQGLPVVYEEHQTPDAQFDWWQGFAGTINKATRVVAVSEQSARALQTVCGVTRPIDVRPPLLPDPLAPGGRLPARTRPADGQVRVTTVARLYVTKGLSYLLQAIPRVREEHPDVSFRVYGDGPLASDLRSQALELGLDPDAIFRGAFATRAALGEIMGETDLFVMSSILEGQPLGLVEAMAYGCPIVTTSVGGIPELIEDGVNGLLCVPGDADALAARIRAAIADPALRERLGHAARRSYEEGPFEPRAVASRLASIYSAALRTGSTA